MEPLRQSPRLTELVQQTRRGEMRKKRELRPRLSSGARKTMKLTDAAPRNTKPGRRDIWLVENGRRGEPRLAGRITPFRPEDADDTNPDRIRVDVCGSCAAESPAPSPVPWPGRRWHPWHSLFRQQVLGIAPLDPGGSLDTIRRGSCCDHHSDPSGRVTPSAPNMARSRSPIRTHRN